MLIVVSNLYNTAAKVQQFFETCKRFRKKMSKEVHFWGNGRSLGYWTARIMPIG